MLLLADPFEGVTLLHGDGLRLAHVLKVFGVDFGGFVLVFLADDDGEGLLQVA